MPTTRTTVCGVPGLSTITTRAAAVCGAPSTGFAGVPRGQLPKPVHVLAGDRLDGGFGPNLGEAVRMALAVEHGGEHRRGDGGGILALLDQLPEAARALPLHLFAGERRMQRDVGNELERCA